MVFSIENAFCYSVYSDLDEFIDNPLLSGGLCVENLSTSRNNNNDNHNHNNSTSTSTSRRHPTVRQTHSLDANIQNNSSMMSCLMDDEDEALDDSLMMTTSNTNNTRRLSSRFAILSCRNDKYNDVLTQPLMAQLQEHLPISKRGESFWLQYSLVQDGASIPLLLSKLRGFDSTVLAIETMDGEVFGAYCTQAWTVAPDWYGNGEGFLWRLRQSRKTIPRCASSSLANDGATVSVSTVGTATSSSRRRSSTTREDEQREVETTTNGEHCENDSDNSSQSLLCSSNQDDDVDDDEREQLEVFKFDFQNQNVQQCHNDRIMIGGGTRGSDPKWGYGISLDRDLLTGSTSPCLTYASPSLSGTHSDGSIFEVRNLEVWALTPCVSVEEAERSQDRKRMLLSQGHHNNAYFSLSNSQRSRGTAMSRSHSGSAGGGGGDDHSSSQDTATTTTTTTTPQRRK